MKKQKRDELLFIMGQLLEHKPDIIPLIEHLLELPSSTLTQQAKPSSNINQTSLNLVEIQQQLKTIINKTIRRGRGEVYWAVEELGKLCEIGDGFANVNQWANAQAVYALITEETITNYERLEDECQIAEVIDICAHDLVLCLDTQRELPENEQLGTSNRQELFASLFNIWQFERNYGGINVDVVDAIVRNILDNERKKFEKWIKQKISPNSSDTWDSRGVLSFLTILAEETHSSKE